MQSISPRTAIMVVFTSFGAAVGALAGTMPVVMRTAGIDSADFGLGLTLSTFATVAAMSLGGTIARFATSRTMLLASLPLFALLLGTFLVSQNPVWFFVAFVPMGFMFGLTDIFMNAEGTAIEHDMGRPVFTAIHGCVSLGVAVFAILSSFMSAMIGAWAVALLTAALFGLSWVMVYQVIKPRVLAGGRSSRVMALPNKLPLVLLGVAAGLIIAAETAALLWSAKLLDEQAPALAAIAGLGAAFYGLCNAVVRFPGDRLRAHFGDLPLMLGSLVIATAGFMVLGLSDSFAVSVAAFAAVGIGTAVLIPCVFAMAAKFVPSNRAGGLSFVSMLSGVPRFMAPWIFGLIAGGYGIKSAFGVVAGVLCIAFALLVLLRSRTATAQA